MSAFANSFELRCEPKRLMLFYYKICPGCNSYFGINHVWYVFDNIYLDLSSLFKPPHLNSISIFLVCTVQRIYPFKNPTCATKGLQSLQLQTSPFQDFILLLKLERVSDCFMSLGSACHNLLPRNDIVSKP